MAMDLSEVLDRLEAKVADSAFIAKLRAAWDPALGPLPSNAAPAPMNGYLFSVAILGLSQAACSPTRKRGRTRCTCGNACLGKWDEEPLQSAYESLLISLVVRYPPRHPA